MSTTIRPTVHGNGTSRGELIDGYTDARSAVLRAIEAMEGCSPNGRDYHPQHASEAFSIAVNEHVARVRALQVVAEELYALALHVAGSR